MFTSIERRLSKKKKNSEYLDDIFLPLDSNFSFTASNFSYFVKIMEELDPSINIIRWDKLAFKDNILKIPTEFKYSDIPKFITLISQNISTLEGQDMIFELEWYYMDVAYKLFELWETKKDKLLYSEISKRYHKIACLYKWIKWEAAIIESYDILLRSERNCSKLGNDIEDLVSWLEFKAKARKLERAEFKLTKEQDKDLYLTFKTDTNKFISKILSLFYEHSEKMWISLALWNEKYIWNILVTEIKVQDILKHDENKSYKNIISKLKSLFNKRIIKNESKYNIRLYMSILAWSELWIKKKLLYDFEKALYNIYLNNIELKIKEKITESIKRLVFDFRSNRQELIQDIKRIVIKDYINSNLSVDRYTELIQKLRTAKVLQYWKTIKIEDWLSIDEKIITDEIVNSYTSILESSYFNGLIDSLESFQFNVIRDRLSLLSEDLASKVIFLIFSNICDNLYYNLVKTRANADDKFSDIFTTVLKLDNASQIIDKNKKLTNWLLFGYGVLDNETRVSRYEEWKYQIGTLKKYPWKYNCMALAIVMDQVISKTFWFKGKGLSIFKQNGEKTNHIMNCIEVWEKLICIDLTNNECHIADKMSFDWKNYFDIMDFPNAYFEWAFDNVSIDYWKNKFFSDWMLEYVKWYLNLRWNDAILSKANRNKAEYWRKLRRVNLI